MLFDVAHNLPALVTAGPFLLCAAVLLGLPLILGVPSPARLAGLLVLGIFLLVMVPYGFRSAILDWRGEHEQATVTAVKSSTSAQTGRVSYTCKVRDAQGRSSTLQGSKQCRSDTRPGDRYEILRDPADLVGAMTSDPPISFAVLLAYSCGAALLMSLLAAQSLARSANPGAGRSLKA
ncbi:hypothetical protein [Streptomyces sp. NPDC020917]|uniref:hypothetical protein n=1 Tax=Streptomyces sp. NPDC020917 TaxID=3365102 RepID=UPI00378F8190